MDTSTRRRLTIYLGLISVALGVILLFRDWREGDGFRTAALVPMAMGLIAIATVRRGS